MVVGGGDAGATDNRPRRQNANSHPHLTTEKIFELCKAICVYFCILGIFKSVIYLLLINSVLYLNSLKYMKS